MQFYQPYDLASSIVIVGSLARQHALTDTGQQAVKWQQPLTRMRSDTITTQPTILHIDMDAFYASVEMREQPELSGQPLVVGGAPQGRGVVAAASYEARKYGIHSAMPAARAKKLCPRAIFLKPRLDLYAQVSGQIRDIFHRYTPLVEPLSLDEAFLDVTGSQALFGSALEIGRQIKREIFAQLQLPASVGVAPNKFLAKLASDLKKPNGFVVVEPNRIQDFLDPLPVGRLWGVGKVKGDAFGRLGIRTIGQLREVPIETLTRNFGEHGRRLWELSRGIDDRTVTPDREAKSISHETTFDVDIDDIEILHAWVIELSEQVARRLRQHSLRGRTVALKIRYHDFQTITRSTTLARTTNITHQISQAAGKLLSTRLPARRLLVRLLGVCVSGLDATEPVQRTLFDEDQQTQESLDHAADEICKKFGSASIGRASGMLNQAKRKLPPKHS